MLSLEQVQLLETKVAKTIEYVQRVTAENAALYEERAGLTRKLEANQKRLDELELLVMRFKEDQSRIEDGIIAALDRLSQFEEAFESSLKDKVNDKKASKVQEKIVREKSSEPVTSTESEMFFEIEKPVENSPEDGTDSNSSNSNAESDSVSAGELDIF